MSILSIKPDFLLPERELIVNKTITLWQKPALIASITEQSGIIKLWIFQQMPDRPIADSSEENLAEGVTHRDEILRRISQTCVGCGHISEFTIQGLKLQTSSSSLSVIEYNPLTYMKLQHFIESGVDFSSIENVNLNELALAEYQLSEGTVFPEIDTDAEIPVSLKTSDESREVLVVPSHLFDLKIGEQDISRSFTDPAGDKEIAYHINELVCYDIWEETMKQFQDEEAMKKLREYGHDDASIEKMKADIPESLEMICPKGHAMLILMYESAGDVQLNFHTTRFLLDKPKHDGSASSIGFIGLARSSDKKCRYGSRFQSCVLDAVPVGFDNTVEIELMSWYKKIPGETVVPIPVATNDVDRLREQTL